MLCSRFSLAFYCIHFISRVYISILISQLTPPPLSTLVSIRLLSTSLCLCFRNAVFVHLSDLEFTPFRLCVLVSVAVITNDQAFRSLNHTNQLLWVSIHQKSDTHLVGLTLGVSRSVLSPGSLGRPCPLFFQLFGRILSLAVAGPMPPLPCRLSAEGCSQPLEAAVYLVFWPLLPSSQPQPWVETHLTSFSHLMSLTHSSAFFFPFSRTHEIR